MMHLNRVCRRRRRCPMHFGVNLWIKYLYIRLQYRFLCHRSLLITVKRDVSAYCCVQQCIYSALAVNHIPRCGGNGTSQLVTAHLSYLYLCCSEYGAYLIQAKTTEQTYPQIHTLDVLVYRGEWPWRHRDWCCPAQPCELSRRDCYFDNLSCMESHHSLRALVQAVYWRCMAIFLQPAVISDVTWKSIWYSLFCCSNDKSL